MNVKKTAKYHSQQIKLNKFTVSLLDKRREILYPISTATEATFPFSFVIIIQTRDGTIKRLDV